MKKNEFIAAISEQTDLSKADVERVVSATFDTITKELKGGGEVPITGFGRFKISQRKARQGRNPATGETMQIAASRSASFKASSKLKEALNG